ncbi:hypothetical protein PFICI_01564 [Pestalotiopsis fici W106-1]|uniref:Apurinic-apyrimidinic endonuclease 1 n=1 Tax=Pestalotiopsis fici (strain W106-1 / CGMCC3.15140) TaxID=1229662 RepID=W3XRB1_PESFW|nr:uncharacterized protein PFICI_01564 [Pestalotiopsis fici W106-1]ETS87736.1 hypothetical protein PFICI_01564 [Pestalotiopsis fici W106-1]
MPLRQSPRKRTTIATTKPQVKTEEPAPSTRRGTATTSAKRTTTKRKVEVVASEEDEDEEEEEEQDNKKAKVKTETKAADQKKPAPAAKKRKTTAASSAGSKKSKAEDMPPLAPRTAVASLKKAMYVGAHVSAAGGVQNAVSNATHIGANAFALFLKSQRKWDNPPMAPEAISGFHHACKHGSSNRIKEEKSEEGSGEAAWDAAKHCVPHGSYLVNLAAAERAKADQAYTAFLDDLKRCEQLGIRLYNFHPGNTNGEPRPAALARIAAQLNKAHAATKDVITLLENMAGQGNVVGTTWEDLRDIIALVDDKSRVGVCIDTCHAFAAGYDLRTPEVFAETVAAFDAIVGRSYLRAFHVNDSKAPFDSHRDLHANIGTGFLGLRAFHSLVNTDGFAGLPMVLETPIDRKGPDGKSVEDKQVWADEIKLLESLIGMDPESDEFKALDKRLQKEGEAERKKIQDQVDRKADKDAKKGTKGKKTIDKYFGGKTKKKAEEDSESE